MTHIEQSSADGAPVSNFEQYRARAHGRPYFKLSVVVREEVQRPQVRYGNARTTAHVAMMRSLCAMLSLTFCATYSHNFDAGAFALEWRQAAQASWGDCNAGAHAVADDQDVCRKSWAVLRCSPAPSLHGDDEASQMQ
jgi:hypothetical protein